MFKQVCHLETKVYNHDTQEKPILTGTSLESFPSKCNWTL